MKYKDYNDYELVSYIRESNEEASDIIFEKYRPLIIKIATKMMEYSKNSGLEINDLIQEGMVGLSTSINTFNQNDTASFYTYAKTCIERKIISTIVAARRQKHKILNESLSLEVYTDNEEITTIDKLVADNSYNPESIIVDLESEDILIKNILEQLTPFEQQVFELKIGGFKYKEIADILEKDAKSIDNALNRIKSKIKNILKNK